MKYTQQNESGRVVPNEHYIDQTDIINELRVAIEDLSAIVGQVVGENYPAELASKRESTNVVKMSYEAITEPTSSNDIAEGYKIGSCWINNGKVYICTDNSTGSAVWTLISLPQIKNNFEAEAEPAVDNDIDEGYSKGSMWIFNNEAYICVDATESNAIWKQITNEAGGNGE